MFLAWEAMSKLIPDLYIGWHHVSDRFLLTQSYLCRHYGLRVYISRSFSSWSYSGRRVRALPDHKYRYACPRQNEKGMAHKHEHHLIFSDFKPGKTLVKLQIPHFCSEMLT